MAVLQYAIDVTNEKEALSLAHQAAANGVQWLEAGHVLIKAVGVQIVTKLKERHPQCVVIADMKTMDMGAEEAEVAARAGADLVMVCGAASDGVVEAAVSTARKHGVRITCSLMGVRDQFSRATQLDRMGVDFILAHRGIDDTFDWFSPDRMEVLKQLAANIKTPLAIGGGINEANFPLVKELGFSVIISGRGITEADDPGQAAKHLPESASELTKVHS